VYACTHLRPFFPVFPCSENSELNGVEFELDEQTVDADSDNIASLALLARSCQGKAEATINENRRLEALEVTRKEMKDELQLKEEAKQAKLRKEARERERKVALEPKLKGALVKGMWKEGESRRRQEAGSKTDETYAANLQMIEKPGDYRAKVRYVSETGPGSGSKGNSKKVQRKEKETGWSENMKSVSKTEETSSASNRSPSKLSPPESRGSWTSMRSVLKSETLPPPFRQQLQCS